MAIATRIGLKLLITCCESFTFTTSNQTNHMKKIIIIYGLIAGLIVSAVMVATTSTYCNNPNANMTEGMIYGFTAMIVAFSMAFIGIRNYRNKYNNGIISFGKAFQIGLLIVLVASTMYMLAWEVEYNFFFSDFGDKYAVKMIQAAKAKGASATELAATTTEMNDFKVQYKNPLYRIFMTYVEILPLGIVITLISAFILKKKKALK